MVLLTLIIAFILRTILSFLPSFAIDMGTWIAWSQRMVNFGPLEFYSKEIWTNYLPGYLYLLWFLGGVSTFFKIPPNSQAFEVILKLPANLADLATAALIFRILLKKTNKKIALLASALYLFNPALIFNSSVWGQVDSIFTFFLLLATYFIVEVRKPVLASLILGLSLLIKPQAVALLPIFAFFLLWRFKLRTFLISIVAAVFLIFILSLPFFIKNPIFGFPKLFIQMAQDYPYTSLFAFNFWWIFGGWQNDTQTSFLIPNQIWGILLWIASQIILLVWLVKNKSRGCFFAAAALTFLSFFVLPTRVHERYLFPFFAFGLVTASIYGRIFWIFWGVLTFLHFLNLYFVYTYYNPNFLKIDVIAQFIDNFSVIIAALTVAIFSLMLGLVFGKKWLKT